MDKNKYKQRMKGVPVFLLVYSLLSIITDLLTKRIDFSFQSVLLSLLKRTKAAIIAYLIIALFWYLFGLTEKKNSSR